MLPREPVARALDAAKGSGDLLARHVSRALHHPKNARTTAVFGSAASIQPFHCHRAAVAPAVTQESGSRHAP
jgi:hypothetical protein